MRGKKISIGLTAVLAIAALTLLVTGTRVSAQTETVLYSFGNGEDGSYPNGVISDAAGNLYGTTLYGGSGGSCGDLSKGCGTVFELSPAQGGGWNEKVLYNFSAESGGWPEGRLIFDGSGNLYGTTMRGGAYHWGTVFELSPAQGGGWQENVLHSFQGAEMDGAEPTGNLIFDHDGNLYGTTASGGALNSACNQVGGGCGTVFELSPGAQGIWTEKVLCGVEVGCPRDGPPAYVILNAAGNLYGTNSGGVDVFELLREKGGDWTGKILYSFGKSDEYGTIPEGLVLDAAGNLYGSTCGGHKIGTVYELSPGAEGLWMETMLSTFGSQRFPSCPTAPLIFDSEGNLYGTTESGGTYNQGTAFELTPGADGWEQTLLYNFGRQLADGSGPVSSLLLDASGNLYGATGGGGTYGGGTVFEIVP
jgi:uncharacterized repeat protein (TIGR03803 family)